MMTPYSAIASQNNTDSKFLDLISGLWIVAWVKLVPTIMIPAPAPKMDKDIDEYIPNYTN